MSHLHDDRISCADDADTSFEIDEPEDEEIIETVIDYKTASATTTTAAATTLKSEGSLNNIINVKRLPTTTTTTTTIIANQEPTDNATIISIFDTPPPSCEHKLNQYNNHMHYHQQQHHQQQQQQQQQHNKQYQQKQQQQQHPQITVPQVSVNEDSGEQTDSSFDSQTCSSTPTTADVADLKILPDSVSPFNFQKSSTRQLTPLQQSKYIAQNMQIYMPNGSIAEDAQSGSVATTTTDVDLDNLPSISPTKIPLNIQHPAAALSESDNQSHTRNLSNGSLVNGRLGHKRNTSSSSYLSNGSQQTPAMQTAMPRMHIYNWIRYMGLCFKNSGIGEPSVYHALVVIFLEFFAWGLLTMPVISVLNQTFPDHTFLMNGLVMGIKGILSFLSAPLIGALSDIWGRKFFLLITVFFTCVPIPLMTINTWWFFAMISISGVFAVTFSVVFAYVADVTTVEERSRAYGLVSATFAASLVISPALGAALMEMYGDTLVVALATAIAVLDVFFILVAVPESLPEKMRPSSWGAPISWEQADPFAALRKVGTDHTILMQCITVLLSYLPEAGQYSCIFVYLKLKMGFNSMEVAIFIAVVGILSISIQVILGYLMRAFGGKRTIILGLILEMLQLLWYGFGSQKWMMWAAGILAALASVTYPAISAFVSIHSNADRQGAVQGMVTGMRGLCNGLGPATFGVIFYLFNVDLNDEQINMIGVERDGNTNTQNETLDTKRFTELVPGPPFVFGAFMVILAILVAIFIPDGNVDTNLSRAPSEKKRVSVDVQYEIEHGHKSGPLSPLMRADSMAQL